jgi:hypothetical protein
MPLNPMIPLAGKPFTPFSSLSEGLEAKGRSELRSKQLENLQSEIDQRKAEDIAAEREKRDQRRLESIVAGAATVSELQQRDPTGQQSIEFLKQRIGRLKQDPNVDTTESEELLQQMMEGQESGDMSSANATIQGVLDVGRARKIPFELSGQGGDAAGFSARSEIIGNLAVGVDNQGQPWVKTLGGETVTGDAAIEAIANSRAVMENRANRMVLTKAQISQSIALGTKMFDQIEPIKLGLANIDEAIELVKGGVNVGPLVSRFPSLTASATKLDNLQKRMGLDVIGAVTFGALSQYELDLALATALPINLEGEPLIGWLEQRKAAQTKLLGFYSQAASFLSSGGTVPEFMEQGKNKGSDTIQVDF